MHFIGHARQAHGNNKEILLFSSDESPIWYTAQEFLHILSLSKYFSLITLQCMEGSNLGPQLSLISKHVVELAYPLTQQESVVFVRALYSRLARDGRLDIAVQEGRRKLLDFSHSGKPIGFFSPVLYTQGSPFVWDRQAMGIPVRSVSSISF